MVDSGNAGQTYSQRQGVGFNLAEDLFTKWASDKGWKCTRLGFDEKNGNVDNFFKLPSLLRNLPDFVITKKDKIYVVNVKGTPRFKKKEFDILDKIEQSYSSLSAPLRYAFCFNNQEPKFFSTEQIKEMYSKESDQQWHDGIVFRKLIF